MEIGITEINEKGKLVIVLEEAKEIYEITGVRESWIMPEGLVLTGEIIN